MSFNLTDETIVDLICIKLNQRQINYEYLRRYVLENGLLNLRPDFILLSYSDQIKVFNYFWLNELVTKFNHINSYEIRRLLLLESEINFYVETFVDSIYPMLLNCGVIRHV
jgi:hypothetical protein